MKSLTLVLLATLWTACTVHAEVVVIVNPAATAPTKEQVVDVYLGKSKEFTPVDLPDSSPLRAEFYQKATGRDLMQVKSVWSRIVFSGKGLAPAEHADAQAVKKAVAANPKLIGSIDKTAVDATVKVAFSLN